MTCFVAFVGVHPQVGTTTLATNVAAILGIVARRKTLLLDLSGNERGICDHLSGSNTGGVLELGTTWLRNGSISTKELTQQIARYDPGVPWAPDASALDVLPGFDRATLPHTESERVFADRRGEFVRALCQTAQAAGYEVRVMGQWDLANDERKDDIYFTKHDGRQRRTRGLDEQKHGRRYRSHPKSV